MRPSRMVAYGVLAVSVLLAAARPAWAHALGVECRLRGSRVEVEAFFDDDTPAQDARVLVTDATKKTVAQGRTDENGRWSFAVPGPGDYLVQVDAGAGHSKRAKMTVPAASENAQVAPISEGPTRQEFTRFPVERVALGLGLLGVGGWAAWFVLRRRGAAGRVAPPAGGQ